ncbi:hypothetical protein AN964_03835 [Heyndrickxia shackletonii]|uniref:Lipoprotein n=1 Tax=Heyndrickxia shackletonii TaxID=157838 RepID=A0A0Q3WUP0_9BACI|nr:hypothetical protein [Heyndrickxia shackletonii]KQL52735.1 hypothetical protein AN964_03835 [Heyndrickxia shackletonii]MBB2482981.1 hypothetical protein [Bacillus sp. APMAM]NEZ00135.1 hypothetical protein [Heyndrickxia shackletonii]RTZ53560.1 hypothetical protein EKO25_22580 [Bacillus sp. SAJ1]
MRKILVMSVILVFALVGCSSSNMSNDNIKANKEKSKSKVSINNNTTTKTSHNKSNGASKLPLRKDGKWVQLGARLYYLQGTVKGIKKNRDGKKVLNLLVEKAFQNSASGAKNPYKIGKIYSFIIKTMPSMDLNQKRVIIYGGQVTSNDQDNFIGAKVVYFQSKNKFVDFKGKPAIIPPKDYPYEF